MNEKQSQINKSMG